MLRHKPMLDLTDEDLTDDNIVAAYSVAVMKDGTKSFEVMRRAEINKVRQTSQTGALGKTDRQGNPIPPKGPWVDWFDQMARKTVIRRHSKTLPMSGDILDVEAADEAIAARSTAALLGSAEPDAPRALPPSREEVAAQGFDPDTGEIRDADDEDTARALDAESLAEMDGAEHPSAAATQALLDRIADADDAIDLDGIEADLADADLREGDAERVKLALANARKAMARPRGRSKAEPETGRADKDHGDAHDGNAAIADKLIERCEAAQVMGDVLNVESEYRKVARDMLDADGQARVEAAIEDAKRRFKKPD